MIAVYKKIDEKSEPVFTMPASLRWRKELGEAGITFDDLHLTDLISIVYSLRIDSAVKYLEYKRHEAMQKRGIKEVKKATEKDFDEL